MNEQMAAMYHIWNLYCVFNEFILFFIFFFSVLAVEWKLHLSTYTGRKLFGPDPLNGCVTSAAVKRQQTQDWASV